MGSIRGIDHELAREGKAHEKGEPRWRPACRRGSMLLFCIMVRQNAAERSDPPPFSTFMDICGLQIFVWTS